MALTEAEIVPGVVAYFSASMLNSDPGIEPPENPTPRDGPFVCLSVRKSRSSWSPLTTQARKERVEILQADVSGGSGLWASSRVFLNDGAVTYVGANASFVSASAAVDLYSEQSRPKLAPSALKSLLTAVRKRRGRLA